MAGHPGLKPALARRLLALAAAVLLAHLAALHVFSRWLAPPGLLKPMVAPMYTRVLQQEQPPEPPQAVAQAPAAEPPPRPGRLRATPSVPARNTRTVADSRPQRRQEAKPEPPPPAQQEPPVTVADAAGSPSAPPPPEPEVAGAAEAPPAVEALPEATPDPGGVAADPAPAAPAAGAPASAPPATSDTASLDRWPADTRLRYRLGGRFRSGDLYGSARVLWQREGARYQVRVEVDVPPFATLTMTSQGEVGPGVLMPQAYEEVRNGKSRGLLRIGEREVMLANGSIVPRPDGLQDTASQFVELGYRFATGQARLEPGSTVSFWMARPARVDRWTYDIVGSEMLATALGQVEAFHLKPRPIANPRGNITAEMWFAPSLQYLPVRIRVNMGDEAHIDLLVEAIEQR